MYYILQLENWSSANNALLILQVAIVGLRISYTAAWNIQSFVSTEVKTFEINESFTSNFNDFNCIQLSSKINNSIQEMFHEREMVCNNKEKKSNKIKQEVKSSS